MTKGIDGMGNKASKAQICLAGDRCVHYPHKAIPEGEEEWVMQSAYGTEALAPYHPECTRGLWYFDYTESDEGPVKASPYFTEQPIALNWLINQVDGGYVEARSGTWELKRAHGNDVVAILREWAELQPLYVKAAAYKDEGDYSQGDEIEADANEGAKDLMTRLVDALQVG